MSGGADKISVLGNRLHSILESWDFIFTLMETNEIKKDEWCPYCGGYGTKTHMCWGKQLAMNPNRLAIPRWVEASEHREQGTGLCTLNFIINE